jgi:arylsulfatase A-like enzyme
MKLSPWTAVLLLVAGCGGSSPHANLDRKPVPVILYLVDTLRADHLGCYGYERDTSPALDALAADGVRFESCQATSSWTKPASASVLTGLLPSQHGAVHKVSALPTQHLLAAEAFQAAGYRTGAFGANGFIFGTEQGFSRGFDVFKSGGAILGGDSEHMDVRSDVLVDAALDWVREAPDEPFFLYVHAIDPHDPYVPTEPFQDRFTTAIPGLDQATTVAHLVQRSDLGQAELNRTIGLYDAEIAFADQELGKLLTGLKDLGLYDEALVVFVADHGEEFRDHGGFGHNPMMYQEVVRVPLVVKFPDSFEQPALRGAVHNQRVSQVDVLPTLMDAVGLELDESDSKKLAGDSLLAKVLDPILDPLDVITISEADVSGTYTKSITQGDWKYIRTWTPFEDERLYDLAKDPMELRDLAPAAPSKLAELRELLSALVSKEDRGWTLSIQNRTAAPLRLTGLLQFDGPPLAGLDPLHMELNAEDMNLRDGPIGQGQLEIDAPQGKVQSMRATIGAKVLPLVLQVNEPVPAYRGRAAWFYMVLEAGDQDACVFIPGAGTGNLRLSIFAEGATATPEYVFLGPDQVHPDAMPVDFDELDSRASEFIIPGQPNPESIATDLPIAVWIWKNLDLQAGEIVLSEDTEAHLRELGYFGDE